MRTEVILLRMILKEVINIKKELTKIRNEIREK